MTYKPAYLDPKRNHRMQADGNLDFADFAPWIREYRGTIRYSSLRETQEVRRTSNDAKIEGKYILMNIADSYTISYTIGAHALQEACKEIEEKEGFCPHPQFVLDNGNRIYRPLAFGEDLAARLQDESLFDNFLDSCTGIVYQKNSTNFKIIPLCKELITIPKGFNEASLKANYTDFDCKELDSKEGKYNELLDEDEAREHQGWFEAAGGNQDLLDDTVDKVFFRLKKKGRKKGMRFWVRKNPDEDELRALFVRSISGSSDAVGDGKLNINGSFLRVAQAAEPHR